MSEAVTRSGPSWNMYSGRAIEPGTWRSGPSLPFVRVPRGARSARDAGEAEEAEELMRTA